jgi:hypothetical protein
VFPISNLSRQQLKLARALVGLRLEMLFSREPLRVS